MELVRELYWDIEPAEITKRQWKVRRAVRALVRDGDKIAVLHSTKYDFYKCLPGGGIEANEDIFTTLPREIQEEVGCEIQVVDELGLCIEFIGDFNLVSLSYVFIVDKTKSGKQQLTAEELAAGFVLEWHTPQEVLSLIERAQPTDKRGGQQMIREKILLEHYLQKAYQ